MKPDILKVILVFVSQTYIDSLIFPGFNKPYEGEKLVNYKNHDIIINAVICGVFFLVTVIVPYLGLENKRKLAKQKLTENPSDPSKNQGETHVLFYICFVSGAFGVILLVLNHLDIMYSPLSCYVPSDRVHEIVAMNHNLSKDFGCHPGEIHI